MKYLHDDVTSFLHWPGFLLSLHAGKDKIKPHLQLTTVFYVS